MIVMLHRKQSRTSNRKGPSDLDLKNSDQNTATIASVKPTPGSTVRK
jgi:hypothetical protein